MCHKFVVVLFCLLIPSLSFAQNQYEGCSNENVTRISFSECSALVDFYYSTNGDQWTDNTNWLNFNVPVSQWHGISLVDDYYSCSGYSCYVNEIVLVENNLQGEIPESLSNLSRLSRLLLSRNELSGEIPQFLGESGIYFYALDLSQNNLTGQIPDNLGNPALNQLDLSHNELTGLIPTSVYQNPFLHELKLNNNKLNGIVPVDLFENFATHTNSNFFFVHVPMILFESQQIDLSQNCLNDLDSISTMEMLTHIGFNIDSFIMYPQGDADYCSAEADDFFNVDYNGNGYVDLGDLLDFLAMYGTNNPLGDINGDGFVGVTDLCTFLTEYNQDGIIPLSGLMLEELFGENKRLVLPSFDKKGHRLIPESIQKMINSLPKQGETKVAKYPKRR